MCMCIQRTPANCSRISKTGGWVLTWRCAVTQYYMAHCKECNNSLLVVVLSSAIVGGVLGGFVFVSFIVALFVLAVVAVRCSRGSGGSKVGGAAEEGVDKSDKSPPPIPRSSSEQNNYQHMHGRVSQEKAFEMSPSVKLLGK